MTDQTQASAALSGRELSRARRQAMSRTGAGGASGSSQASTAQQPAAQALVDASGKPLTGRALSIARRALLAKGGKSAIAGNTQAPARTRRKPAASEPAASPTVSAAPSTDGATAASSDTATEEHCCDSCAAGLKCECECDDHGHDAASNQNESMEELCEIIESNPQAAGNVSSSVRAYCRERRRALSQKGKLALPGKAGKQARKALVRTAGNSSLTASALTGRALAKLYREDRCQFGRGDKAPCRPSGRVRPRVGNAPPKVEVGTTLSGQSVTGTQVEQTEKVTGSESGSCHNITGTEYLGAEQFSKFCSAIPEPAAAKVGVSQTTHGQVMTGTEVAANDKVTGSEAGSCAAVTGNEYLGVEHFAASCSSRSVMPSQEKVATGRTEKNLRITGVDEARGNAVTGSEYGITQHVTGSPYIDREVTTPPAAAPAKVDYSHNASGIAVTGGESSRSFITGDEHGACARITGVEYVSNERFQSVCGTTPPAAVAKVGVDRSRGGMQITGNLVDRDDKVTGNEPGTCQRVTGSQYDSSASKGFCDQRADKVQQTHTLHGRPVSGTEVNHSPKLTGDDRGSCSVVTGTEYVSRESYQQSCSQVPPAGADKTAVSQTWNNQTVTGAQPVHSDKTTGDDTGICAVVTGSSYTGYDQTRTYCAPEAVAMAEPRMRHHHASKPVSGITPGLDERLGGNFQRGQCQSISGTPYQGMDSQVQEVCGQAHTGQHPLTQAPTKPAVEVTGYNSEAEPYESDFSVISPARAAFRRRQSQPVHNSVIGVNNAITGSVNKAQGVISGTPEFRHTLRDTVATAPVQPVADAAPQASRITGEGSEAGAAITGDDWSRSSNITGTEGMFSATRNQTQRGGAVPQNRIGAHALKDREPPEVSPSRVTGSSGGSSNESAMVTLSGGAIG